MPRTPQPRRVRDGSGWIRAHKRAPSDAENDASVGLDEPILLSWQQNLGEHLPKYRKLARMSPATPHATCPATPSSLECTTPRMRTPSTARLERKQDAFAMIEEVWRGAMDTPKSAANPAQPLQARQQQTTCTQTTLDTFTRPLPGRHHMAPPAPRAFPPSPPDSLSSCSTVPGDSDDDLGSPTRSWIRALGSSPTEWAAQASP